MDKTKQQISTHNFVADYVYQTFLCVEGNNRHCRTKGDFNKANTSVHYLGNRSRSVVKVITGDMNSIN